MNHQLNPLILIAYLLLFGGLLAYVGFVGATGKCPSCLFLPNSDSNAEGGLESNALDSGEWPAAPALNLTLVDGTSLKSETLEGKVLLVDFWATWCPPCRQMIPGLVELQNEYQERGFLVLGLSVDQGDAEAVRRFMEKEGINYPVALADQATSAAFGGIEYLPTSFLINRAGRIVSRHVGYTTKDELAARIKPLLNAPRIATLKP